MAIQIQHRRGTAAQWTSANPILAEGEMGVETDTLKVKMGDGVTRWNTLIYFTQGLTGPANSLTVGTVTQSASASATITGTAPNQTLNLGLPKGDAATITVGTTTTTNPGTSATVVNAGTANNATLNFAIPRGTTVALGTTTTGAAGSNATVTNSGTASDLVLDFSVPTGVGVPTGGTTGQVVQKTASATQWTDFNLSNLKDVTVTSPATGQAITYNGTKWVNATPVSNLVGLSDVTITSPADKQVLQYEAATSKWKNKAATGGVTTGATAPATPMSGDAWYDTTDGLLYVYVVDANSSQWVEVKANSALEASITPRIATVESRATAVESRTTTLEQNPSISGSMTVAGNATINGRIVAPNQPAFNAVGTFGAADFAAGAQIPFAQIITNKGNCYNTTTSKFTAPIAGTYSFTFSVYRYSGYIAQPSFRINGTEWTPGDVALAVAASATGDATITLTMIVSLAAGDYVHVAQRSTVAARYYAGHSFFMGHLIG